MISKIYKRYSKNKNMKFKGTNYKGAEEEFYIDENASKTFDVAIRRVKKQGWDYCSIGSGIPGSGKSTMLRTFAKYVCPWFSLDYIVFTADEFIRITNECPEFSAVVLDESFASLNTKIAMSPDFVKIINHIQLLRQKHLFIFLALPNFFDLSKGVSVFRSSHLFVCYDDDGERGRFAAYDRTAKRKMYVLGSKFMDYSVVHPNFRGRFTKNDGIVDEDTYEQLKRKHLMDQGVKETPNKAKLEARDKIFYHIYKNKLMTVEEMAEISGMTKRAIYLVLKKSKSDINEA